ncbi:hypothetical protein [uncultured Cohaesibacter sp.]|uniref:hypothetical protein n=1 Tax=uncultured Cohaesibacter sp. TaxID=1002546 RepID=UPI0029C8AC33|nr:hypothetical protein [uncultured Cohaesibacter sp.]
MFNFRFGFSALAAYAIALTMLAAPAQAEDLTKDLFRARVVDFCLYDRWEKAKNDETDGILEACKCAAEQFVDGLKGKELDDALRKGEPGWTQKRAVLSAYEACKK